MPLLVRWLSWADSSSFWAAPTNEYRLERWTFDGRKLAELVGDREWFKPWVNRPDDRSPHRPPKPFLSALTSDHAGRLWVLFGIASPRWSEALDTLRDQMGSRLIRPGGIYRNSVLEVVDPTRSALIASTRIEGSWTGFADSRHLWRTWIDAGREARTIVVTLGFHDAGEGGRSRSMCNQPKDL